MRTVFLAVILFSTFTSVRAQADSTSSNLTSIKVSLPKLMNINRFPTAHLYLERSLNDLWSIQGNVGIVLNHMRKDEKFLNKRGVKTGVDIRRYLENNGPTSGFIDLSFSYNRIKYDRAYTYQYQFCDNCYDTYYQYDPYTVTIQEAKLHLVIGGKLEIFKNLGAEGLIGYGYLYRFFDSEENAIGYISSFERHDWDDKTKMKSISMTIDLRLTYTIF